MKKEIISYKKRKILVYVEPSKENLYKQIVKRAEADCKICHDKKGLIDHIVNSLNRNGFKTIDLDSIEERKVSV